MADQLRIDAEHGSMAILVLACASPPYDKTIETIRQTWGSLRVPGIDVYYVYGVPHPDDAHDTLPDALARPLPEIADDEIAQVGDVLIAGCADSVQRQIDCLLRKRLIAFEYLSGGQRYDWVYTVCATSYVGLDRLMRHATSLPRRPFVFGPISVDRTQVTPFVSGASMLMTVDVAAKLGDARDQICDENQFRHMDDVTIGHWVATHMGDLSLESVVNHVKERRVLPSDYILIDGGGTTRDFVVKSPESHFPAPDAFHYHFNSQRPEDMRRFHERYTAKLASESL